MTIFPALQQFTVPESVTGFFLERLVRYRSERFATSLEDTATVAGFQTPNLLELNDDEVTAQLSELLQLLETETGIRFSYFWAHLIDYEDGGYQKMHEHSHNEDYSFVLYLSSSDSGQTKFLLNADPRLRLPIDVLPRKSQLVLFLSQLKHEGREARGGKKVLVGGLRIVGIDAGAQGWTLGDRHLGEPHIDDSDILVVNFGVTMVSRTEFDEDGSSVRSLTLTSPANESLKATPGTAAVLEALDGRRSVGDVISHLHVTGSKRFSEGAVRDLLLQLLRENIVRRVD